MKRWPLNKAYFWETAPFFRLLPPLVAGVACPLLMPAVASALPVTPLLAVAGIGFAIFLVAALAFKQTPFLKVVNFFSLHVALFTMGWLLYLVNDIRQQPDWFGHQVGKGGMYLARITSAPVEKDKTYKLEVSVIRSINGMGSLGTTGPAMLYLYKDTGTSLQEGDTILVPGLWQCIANPVNPFSFDYAAYCARNNLYYQQFVPIKSLKLYGKGNAAKAGIADKVHNWCMKQLDVYLPSPQVKGLIQAMVVGDESNLDPSLRDSYAATGIVHIIAISGGNITLFFILVASLLWWLRHKKHLWVKYIIALPLVWFYVVISGNSPSAVRAACMFTVLAAGITFQKQNNPLNQLFATAFLLICVNPAWILSIGFQLSFIAVLSLILFYKPVYGLYSPANIIIKKLWAAVASALAAEILIAPLVAYYFHIFPVFFIVANVAAFIFMEVVLVAGMLLLVTSFIPILAKGIGWSIVMATNFFDQFVSSLQAVNPAAFNYLGISLFELLVIYLLIGCLTLLWTGKHRCGFFSTVICACILLVSLCHSEYMALTQRRLVICNIKGMAYIELVNGKRYKIIYTDAAYKDKNVDRALKPAHSAWHVWQSERDMQANEVFVIGKKSVMIVSEPFKMLHPFHVDCLVFTRFYKEYDSKFIQQFSPDLVIIATDVNHSKSKQWLSSYIDQDTNLLINNNGGMVIVE